MFASFRFASMLLPLKRQPSDRHSKQSRQHGSSLGHGDEVALKHK
jgi:hypothetical protein